MKSRLLKSGLLFLVALVVTIVIILILAGITIEFVTGPNGIIEQAKNAPKQQRAAKWKKYFEFRESCLILINIAKADGTVLHYRNLDYGFSLTSHKSQGSTYNVSMVDINDIVYDKNGHPYNNAKDINRRLYVAVSRAKEKVILRYG